MCVKNIKSLATLFSELWTVYCLFSVVFLTFWKKTIEDSINYFFNVPPDFESKKLPNNTFGSFFLPENVLKMNRRKNNVHLR